MILKAGLLYFAIVFGAGFVLGTIRTLWVVPRLGARMAELMETPIMFAAAILAARWTVLRLAIPSTPSARLMMGGIALAFLIVAECGALASSSFDKRIRGKPRPCFGNCLLLGACTICHHATVRG